MRSPLRLLAVDIGAESGRGIVGTFEGDRVQLEEVYRFPNVPVRLEKTLYWDFLRIYGDVLEAIQRAGQVASVGIDTWGVDFGLLGADGRLLGNPVHYRDARTTGILERLDRARVFATTGIQFMEINTLCQLLAMVEARDPDLERAERLLLIPDLLNHFLCGSAVVEYTNATTTQCLDALQHGWARGLLTDLGIPVRLFPEVVQPGAVLGTLHDHAVRVIAPGTHDTASAVAAIPLNRNDAYLSSGTWSLLGLEVDQPVLTDEARAFNLTNEGGVSGKTRLLKNVMGLWLVQQVRSATAAAYEELTASARDAPAFTAFVDPDDARFFRLRTADIRTEVEVFCRETQQPEPTDTGTLTRVLLESLALKYALVLRQLEQVTTSRVEALHVVGGGARNRLLCQMTADATGVPVLARAIEATALGNLLVQAIALGELASLDEARELVRRSFDVERYEPHGDWSAARARFNALYRTRQSVAA